MIPNSDTEPGPVLYCTTPREPKSKGTTTLAMVTAPQPLWLENQV